MKYRGFYCVFVIIAMFLVIGCSPQRLSHEIEKGLIRKYNVVSLEELMERPGMFTGMPIKFRCLMGKTGEIFNAMNTHFLDTDMINFGVWPEKTRMWIDEEAQEKYHPLVYISKKSSYFPLFRDVKLFEVIDIYGIVRDTYVGKAWIEAKALARVFDEKRKKYKNHFDTEVLFYIKNAVDYEKNNEFDFAIEDYSEALNRSLPRFAENEILLRKGELLFKKEDYEEAKEILEKCTKIKDEQGNYKAYALLGEVYRQLNKFSEAVKYSKQALKIKPNYYPALRTYGISLAKSETKPDYEEAEKKCLRALKFDTTDPTTNWYLAQIYELQKKHNESIDFFKRAIDYFPQNYKYHKGLAGVYHKRSNLEDSKPEQALSDKRIAIHEYDIVKTILRRTKQQDADIFYFSGVVKEEIADYLKKENKEKEAQGFFDEATKSYEQCVAKDPDYVPAWQGLAGRYVGYGRYDEAIEVYDNLMRLKPKNTDIIIGKALILYNDLKDKGSAIDVLKKAIKLDGNNVKANYLIGRYLLESAWEGEGAEKKDLFSQSAKSLERVLKVTVEKHIEALRDAVFAYYGLRKMNEVIDRSRKLLLLLEGSKKKELQDEDKIKVYNYTGDAYIERGKSKEATPFYEKSLRLNANHYETNIKMAKYYLYELKGSKGFGRAEKYAKKAISLKPTWEAWDLYGWSLSQNGKSSKALKDVYQPLQKKGVVAKQPVLRFHIGVVYSRVKNAKKALEYLDDPVILENAEYRKTARKIINDLTRR